MLLDTVLPIANDSRRTPQGTRRAFLVAAVQRLASELFGRSLTGLQLLRGQPAARSAERLDPAEALRKDLAGLESERAVVRRIGDALRLLTKKHRAPRDDLRPFDGRTGERGDHSLRSLGGRSRKDQNGRADHCAIPHLVEPPTNHHW
jgi:hypothetical protein